MAHIDRAGRPDPRAGLGQRPGLAGLAGEEQLEELGVRPDERHRAAGRFARVEQVFGDPSNSSTRSSSATGTDPLTLRAGSGARRRRSIVCRPGPALAIENAEPFILHFGFDGWQNVAERASTPLAFTLHGVRLEPNELADHAVLDFTRRSPPGSWEGADHAVELLGER
jgi:hypothetical protein